MSRESITKHEGSKYLKKIVSPVDKDYGSQPEEILVDVYAVLVAFDVTCPAIAHCIKKLLMPGQRGKGDVLADLKGAMAALNRAIDIEEYRHGERLRAEHESNRLRPRCAPGKHTFHKVDGPGEPAEICTRCGDIKQGTLVAPARDEVEKTLADLVEEPEEQ